MILRKELEVFLGQNLYNEEVLDRTRDNMFLNKQVIFILDS